jgi:hypothetical protein
MFAFHSAQSTPLNARLGSHPAPCCGWRRLELVNCCKQAITLIEKSGRFGSMSVMAIFHHLRRFHDE